MDEKHGEHGMTIFYWNRCQIENQLLGITLRNSILLTAAIQNGSANPACTQVAVNQVKSALLGERPP